MPWYGGTNRVKRVWFFFKFFLSFSHLTHVATFLVSGDFWFYNQISSFKKPDTLTQKMGDPWVPFSASTERLHSERPISGACVWAVLWLI